MSKIVIKMEQFFLKIKTKFKHSPLAQSVEKLDLI